MLVLWDISAYILFYPTLGDPITIYILFIMGQPSVKSATPLVGIPTTCTNVDVSICAHFDTHCNQYCYIVKFIYPELINLDVIVCYSQYPCPIAITSKNEIIITAVGMFLRLDFSAIYDGLMSA